MKKPLLFLFVLIFSGTVFSEEVVTTSDGRQIILYDDHTWAEKNLEKHSPQEILKTYQPQLRSGVKATAEDILTACEMLAQGWTYTMPRPKSAQAAWEVTDGRTTWWKGYWFNAQTDQYSDATPKKTDSGLFLGDNQNCANTWRNGGSPPRPDIYMFLLSDSGGPPY